jgi:uncharacterized BrkB/YihY/UPF0761 family membrane protein
VGLAQQIAYGSLLAFFPAMAFLAGAACWAGETG